MHLVVTILVGLIVGAVAKLLVPGRDPGGIAITLVLGIAGALLAGWAGRTLGLYRYTGEGAGIIASIIGAVVLLVGYRAVSGRPVH